jgi:hypothetical protein
MLTTFQVALRFVCFRMPQRAARGRKASSEARWTVSSVSIQHEIGDGCHSGARRSSPTPRASSVNLFQGL